MVDPPGDPPQPGSAAMGASGSWCRPSARRWRWLQPLPAPASSALYGVAFLGRPRSRLAAEAREVDRFSLAAMFAFAVLCLAAGLLPGFVIDGLAPAVADLVGGAMPEQSSIPWLSIVPVAESRSSYNGLLVFLFIAASASLAAYAITASPRTRSAALRHGTAGSPTPVPRPSTPAAASPSRSAGSSRRWFSSPASGSRCRRPGISAPRGSR